MNKSVLSFIILAGFLLTIGAAYAENNAPPRMNVALCSVV